MTKAELYEQIESMTDEEAAEVKLIFAPDWPSKATSIEEVRKRTGAKPMSPEDFDRYFGSLPTDGGRARRTSGFSAAKTMPATEPVWTDA